MTAWDDLARALGGRDTAPRRGGRARGRRWPSSSATAGRAGIELLFIRRAEHEKDPWSGQMGFPGGRAEPGDPGPEATAVRETLEETGLDLAGDGERLGALDEVKALARGRPVDLVIAPFVFRLSPPARRRPEPRGGEPALAPPRAPPRARDPLDAAVPVRGARSSSCPACASTAS